MVNPEVSGTERMEASPDVIFAPEPGWLSLHGENSKSESNQNERFASSLVF